MLSVAVSVWKSHRGYGLAWQAIRRIVRKHFRRVSEYSLVLYEQSRISKGLEIEAAAAAASFEPPEGW